MREFDVLRPLKIGNRTSELQESEVDPGREIHAFECLFEEFILFFAERTVFFDILLGYLRIVGLLRSLESLGTKGASLFNLLFDIGRGASLGCPISEVFDLDSWHSDEEINTIEDRSGEFGAVPFDLRLAADTGFFFVSEMSARTWIECTDEDEFRWIRITRIDPIDRDLTVFERLSEHLEEMGIKFEELIEEENSLVRETDLSGTRVSSSSDDTDTARRMMHFAEWTGENEWMFFRQESGNRVNLGRLDDFGEIHIREDRGERFREHRLPGSRRSLHEDIVSSGSGDHESPFSMFLPDDMFESYFG